HTLPVREDRPMNQHNEWRPEDAHLYQPSARPAPGTGYGPMAPLPDSAYDVDAVDLDQDPPRRRTGRKILITVAAGVVALFALVLLLGYIGSARTGPGAAAAHA